MAASAPNPPPEPPNGGSVGAASTEAKFRRWLKELSRGVRWLLGVIIVAVVGVLVAAVARGCAGPAELGAELSDVAIDRNVTLDEYAIRHQSDSASRLGSASVVHLEVHLVAQTTPENLQQAQLQKEEQPQGEQQEEQQQEEQQHEEQQQEEQQHEEQQQEEQQQEEQQQEEQQQEQQQQEEQPQDGQEPGGETTPDDTGIILRSQLSHQESEQFNAGVHQAIDESQMYVGRACGKNPIGPRCPFATIVFEPGAAAEPADVEPGTLSVEGEGPLSVETVARRLKKIFNGTRTRPALPASGRRQPVGVTVNFNVSMAGFDDGRADIRWSLYSARGNAPVPRDWLRTQRALSLRGEADKDSASGEFWVPLPKAKGPFFIRVGVYDDDNTRLDYADTPCFR